jgi:drug/metabolite transporter (DMT)-like permease
MFGRMLFSLPLLWGLAFVEGIPEIDVTLAPILAAAVPLEVLAGFLYIRAIRISPLSSTVPLLSFTPVFLLVTSPQIVKEVPRPLGLAGVLIIVSGTYILNIHNSKDLLSPFKKILNEHGALYMLVVAFIFSITSNLVKLGINASAPAFFGALYFTLVTIIIGTISVARHGLQNLLNRRLILIGVFFALMVFFHMIAVKLTLVSYMIAVKRTSLLFSIILGLLFLKESGVKQKLLGGVLMIAGIALIAVFG